MTRILMSGVSGAALAITGLAAPAAAQADKPVAVEVGPGTRLADALKRVAIDAGLNLLAPAELLAGRTAPELNARLPAAAAVERLLAGAPLRARVVDDTIYIEAAEGPFDAGAGERESAREIVVTGTRIRGAAPAGASVISVDREDIDRSGYATTAQILQSLPQNFGGSANESNLGLTARNRAGSNGGLGSSIDLRGLGSVATLVLFDGVRPALGGVSGAFADLSLVPSAAIERIEVLADGASAIYGSDAISGVVNIRFRDRFDGAETRLRAGTADGDFEEYQASQLLGAAWSSGRIMAAYQFDRREALDAADRDFATLDLRPFGGRDYRTDYSNPGTLIAANGQIFGIPAGQDGRDLEASDLLPGAPNRTDSRRLTDLLPRQETHSVHVSGEQLIAGGLEAYGRLNLARRRFSSRTVPGAPFEAVVTSANPFYVDPLGTGAPVRVRYDFTRDLGPETRRGTVEGYSGVLGLRRDFGDWTIDLQASHGAQVERTATVNVPNRARLAEALALADPATAYNLFGDGSFTNPATIERVRGSVRTRSRFRVWAGAIRADGPLLSLPAGEARLAVGGEYRDEGLDYRTFNDTRTLVGPVEQRPIRYPPPRQVMAAYGELFLPLFGAANRLPGFEQLDVSLAVRTESYSDVGSTTNPKFGLTWEPVEGVQVRSTYGTSFRAPTMDELVGSAIANYQPFRSPDPASPTGFTTALALFGFSDGIKPETAETWTAGLDLAPTDGVRLSATLFDIDYAGRIGTATQDILNFMSNRPVYGGLIIDNPDPALVAFYYASPSLNNPLGIPAGEIRAILDGRVINLSAVHMRGVDGELNVQRALWGGSFGARIGGSYIFFQKQRLTATAPPSDVVGTFGSPVEFRARGQLSWSNDRLSLTGTLNHIAGYSYQIGTAKRPVPSWRTLDLQLGWRFTETLRIAISASNVFDRDPPFIENATTFSAIGYDPGTASAIGRLVALQLVKSW